jgi:hypothetical protein
MKKSDIKEGLTREEWEKQCEHYSMDAFYTPPTQFLFHHYDEDTSKVLVCHRPMIGIEKYVVEGKNGGYYGVYNTRDVSYYIKSGTWIIVEDPEYFIQHEIEQLERKLADLRTELTSL